MVRRRYLPSVFLPLCWNEGPTSLPPNGRSPPPTNRSASPRRRSSRRCPSAPARVCRLRSSATCSHGQAASGPWDRSWPRPGLRVERQAIGSDGGWRSLSRKLLAGNRSAHAPAAIGDQRHAEFVIEVGQFLIHGRRNGSHVAGLRDGGIAAFGQLRDLLPEWRGRGNAAALDGIDDQVLLHGFLAYLRVFGSARVIHVRRRVANQEDDLQYLPVLAPRHLADGILERLVHGLRLVAAARGL